MVKILTILEWRRLVGRFPGHDCCQKQVKEKEGWGIYLGTVEDK